MYTDVSKYNTKVAAVVAVFNQDVFSVRLPNEETIFSAEAKTIQPAFGHKVPKDTHFTIISYSLSCL